MKRILSLTLALILLLSAPLSVFAEEDPAQKDPIYDIILDSQGAYFINLETETVLYSKAENARLFPASVWGAVGCGSGAAGLLYAATAELFANAGVLGIV